MSNFGIRFNSRMRLLETVFRRAEAGDVLSAKRILRYFVDVVKDNTDKSDCSLHPTFKNSHIDERVIRHLADCFVKILAGVSADKALGVKPGQEGRPDLSDKGSRDLNIALGVTQEISKGHTVTNAMSVIATQYNLGDASIRKIYYKNKVEGEATFALLQSLQIPKES